MREILFRGKLIGKNNEWSLGNLNVSKKGFTIITPDETVLGVYGAVIPETVGQFTGLLDKNGTKIFEGDIVHCISRMDNANMVVIFESGEYRMVLSEQFAKYKTGCGYYNVNCFEKEVIGNIHDNPELLKEDL